jgi:hypothetical protein
VWLAPYSAQTTNDYDYDALTASMSEMGDYVAYEFPRGTASMTTTATIDEQTGSKFYTTEITLQFNGIDAVKLAEVQKVVNGEISAVVFDNNDKRWMPTATHPLIASAVEITTGAQYSDGNRISLTLRVESPYPPLELTINE